MPGVAVDPAVDLALLPYSSGTTGLAKGVMLTHSACIANVVQSIAGLPIGPPRGVLAVAPFFHAVGWGVVAGLRAAQRGHAGHLPRFDVAAFLAAVQEHRDHPDGRRPAVSSALARHPAVADYDLSSLRWLGCGAAPLAADLQNELHRPVPAVPVVQGYGMTEDRGDDRRHRRVRSAARARGMRRHRRPGRQAA